MCYDVRYLTKRIKKYADHAGGNPDDVARMENQLRVFREQVGAVYHTTAFDHWKLPVIKAVDPGNFQFCQWGLIPHFVKDIEQYHAKYATRYLNSRIETLFEEKLFNAKLNRELENPFYRSALDRRCVVVLDGYFDWHWQGKNSYNFHIKFKNDDPMYIAGIWRQWSDASTGLSMDTVSLITTDANPLCRKVHNRPKASEGARQLAILNDEAREAWMNIDLSPEQLQKEIGVFPDNELVAFPVKKLFRQEGRRRISLNEESCVAERQFPELTFGRPESPTQETLF